MSWFTGEAAEADEFEDIEDATADDDDEDEDEEDEEDEDDEEEEKSKKKVKFVLACFYKVIILFPLFFCLSFSCICPYDLFDCPCSLQH